MACWPSRCFETASAFNAAALAKRDASTAALSATFFSNNIFRCFGSTHHLPLRRQFLSTIAQVPFNKREGPSCESLSPLTRRLRLGSHGLARRQVPFLQLLRRVF